MEINGQSSPSEVEPCLPSSLAIDALTLLWLITRNFTQIFRQSILRLSPSQRAAIGHIRISSRFELYRRQSHRRRQVLVNIHQAVFCQNSGSPGRPLRQVPQFSPAFPRQPE